MRSTRRSILLPLSFVLIATLPNALAGFIQHPQISSLLPADASQHRQTVKDAFVSAYTDWQVYGNASDDLAVKTRTGVNPRNGWGATTVDALGTMKIMGLDVHTFSTSLANGVSSDSKALYDWQTLP